MKFIIYQVFTRLFGNDNTTRKPNGSIAENGAGKFADFTPKALQSIRRLGVTHVWYTGVLEHATQTDYTAFGIASDPTEQVKGKAGSPYAVKDYYAVCPDLAVDVAQGMAEFESLMERTHRAGLRAIIDFVPNHVAPTCANFEPQNFCYLPESAERIHDYDWTDTVKLNYASRDTWERMRDILLFWAGKGVDGFRCDMAEMVTADFWAWAIPEVKRQFPGVLFIAEVYNPAAYRHYLFHGQFDYLYDKVGLYDTLRGIVEGHRPASDIAHCWQAVDGIGERMLNFLENHDEQRIASDFFAGDARRALPAMLVAATMNVNPLMIYFGQELGERGMESEGFSGRDGRTTIFDYWSVDSLVRRRNGGAYTTARLTTAEKSLHTFYQTLLNACLTEPSIASGSFYDLTYLNFGNPDFDTARQYAFLRQSEGELLLVAANFESERREVRLRLAPEVFEHLRLKPCDCTALDLLSGEQVALTLSPDEPACFDIEGYGGRMLRISPTSPPRGA